LRKKRYTNWGGTKKTEKEAKRGENESGKKISSSGKNQARGQKKANFTPRKRRGDGEEKLK